MSVKTIMSFYCLKSEQGYDISALGSPKKSVQLKQDVGDVSIVSCNKIIFIAVWR